MAFNDALYCIIINILVGWLVGWFSFSATSLTETVCHIRCLSGKLFGRLGDHLLRHPCGHPRHCRRDKLLQPFGSWLADFMTFSAQESYSWRRSRILWMCPSSSSFCCSFGAWAAEAFDRRFQASGKQSAFVFMIHRIYCTKYRRQPASESRSISVFKYRCCILMTHSWHTPLPNMSKLSFQASTRTCFLPRYPQKIHQVLSDQRTILEATFTMSPASQCGSDSASFSPSHKNFRSPSVKFVQVTFLKLNQILRSDPVDYDSSTIFLSSLIVSLLVCFQLFSP